MSEVTTVTKKEEMDFKLIFNEPAKDFLLSLILQWNTCCSSFYDFKSSRILFSSLVDAFCLHILYSILGTDFMYAVLAFQRVIRVVPPVVENM